MLYGEGRQGRKAPSLGGGEGQGTEFLGVGDGEQETRLKTGDPDQCPLGQVFKGQRSQQGGDSPEGIKNMEDPSGWHGERLLTIDPTWQ